MISQKNAGIMTWPWKISCCPVDILCSFQGFNLFYTRDDVLLKALVVFPICWFNANQAAITQGNLSPSQEIVMMNDNKSIYISFIRGICSEILIETCNVAFFQCYSEYTVGNCQVWYYIAMFTFVFYIGEMGYAISVILKTPKDQTVKKVILTMIFHATKIIYRAITLMTVNNFLYDICRPVYKYLSQVSIFQES